MRSISSRSGKNRKKLSRREAFEIAQQRIVDKKRKRRARSHDDYAVVVQPSVEKIRLSRTELLIARRLASKLYRTQSLQPIPFDNPMPPVKPPKGKFGDDDDDDDNEVGVFI